MIKSKQNFETALKNVTEIAENICKRFASECDANHRFPCEALDAIKEKNLHALFIPQRFGGWGFNFYEYQRCLTILAQACSSTAAAFNMHNMVVGSIGNYELERIAAPKRAAFESKLKHIFDLIIVGKKIFAAATTEPGVGARFTQIKTNFEKTKDGFCLNGRKSFVTMASYADYYLVLANKKNIETTSHHWLTYFLVPRQSTGVNIVEDWDVLGMRGTASYLVEFHNVKLNSDALFMGQQGFALTKVMQQPHWVTGGYLGVYLGIMEAVFDFTCEYIRQRTNYDEQTGLGYKPLIQARIGEMFGLLNNARLSVFESATKVSNNPDTLDSHQSIYAAKYYLGETMPQLATLALRTCGGAAISRKFDLERLLRDSMCGGLMPAVSDMCQVFLGKTLLKIPELDIW